MAYAQTIVFEVDAATGNDNNGGGFDATSGIPGTNYAWGADQTTFNYTDIVIGATTTQGTSVNRPFIAADVNNVVNTTAQTGGATLGSYQIKSVAAGVATFDRSLGTATGVFTSAILGGSLATIQTGINRAFINAGAVADCRVYVKKGAYTGMVALTDSGGVSPVYYRSRVICYYQNHDDTPSISSGNQPTYAVGSGAGVNGYNFTINGVHVENMTFVGTAVGSGTRGVIGANINTSYVTLTNCSIRDFSSSGVHGNSYSLCTDCEATLCGGDGFINLSAHIRCWSHKNGGSGFNLTTGAELAASVASNNGSNGVYISSVANIVERCVIYGNVIGVNGALTYSFSIQHSLRNCIIAKNGTGISATENLGAIASNGNNGFYGNTTQTTNYTLNASDVVVTSNPFISSDADLASETNPNWELNNTAGAGAALRATGFPGTLSALSTSVGYADIGLFQHQDAGGAGGIVMSRVFAGF